MPKLKWIACIFGVVGLGLVIGAGFAYVHTASFVAEAARGEGTVVEIVRRVSRSSDRAQSVTYAPVVRYTTEGGEIVEFQSRTSSNPPAYHTGEPVTVLYRREAPYDAEIDSFAAQWMVPLILGGIGSLFVLVAGAVLLSGPFVRRRQAHLRRHGVAVETELQGIERNLNYRANGRNPFRVVTQWQNPATGEIHVFKSENLWFDPSAYIGHRKIRVLIERNNPRRYHVDLSFLPKMAE